MDFKTKTNEEAYDFLVRAGIIRPNERTLEGQEKADVWLILQFLDAYKTTNNQRFITEYYKYGDNDYQVTFFDEDEYDIVEVKENFKV
jgi:hypothetical protein